MSKNTKNTRNKRITKEDGIAYERYLYAKLMTITTMLYQNDFQSTTQSAIIPLWHTTLGSN